MTKAAGRHTAGMESPARQARAGQITIAITRAPDDAAEFLKMAKRYDAKAYALPTIQIVSKGQKIVDEFLDAVDAESPDYVVFMSSKAVKLLFDMARASSSDRGAERQKKEDGITYDRLRLAVANMTVIAVGPKTRKALEQEGIRVNEMPPKTYSSVGVGELFTGLGAVGRKVIVPRSGASTPFLKDLLEKIGLKVVEIYLYDVCAFSDTSTWNGFRDEFAADGVDGIVFTSASSVRGFVEIMSKDYSIDRLCATLNGGRITTIAIGPFTADEMKKIGIKNMTVSKVHTVPGAFHALTESLNMQDDNPGVS